MQRNRIHNCFRMNNYLAKKYNVVQGSHTELGKLVVSPTFASNSLKVIFKLFILTELNHHCVKRRIKL